ncbi:uncharacterized protein LOC126410317 [Nymphaea colorata]|uniref:uncharacterized protein LOC126410317 n=1 Tax=Nymphaea colorata TaxID=210225 RepID=UPI00214E61A8|nr:uncharacterized protein LOC126410317 [Nymphaea colorata]
MNMKRVIERTDQGNSQNVLAMNVKFGKSHGNTNHGGRGILPTPHNQGISPLDTSRKIPICFQCNKKGHMKAQCWFNPQNKNKGVRHDYKQGGQSSKSTAEDMQQLLMAAFSKMTIKQNEQGEWFLDSGAATHVTGNAGPPNEENVR